MKMLQLQHLRSWKKRRLPLRLRLALWSGALVLVLSFGLLLFINSVAFSSFHRIIRDKIPPPVAIQHRTQPACFSVIPFVCLSARPSNPLELALIFELRNISLVGLGLVAVLGGAGAYWFAGIALRPVRRVSTAARQISANTLDTRLALEGPKDEIKELADTFDAMLERLGRTFEQQNRFVADVAHELRTPLASLRTNLEVVAADKDATLDDYRTMVATQEGALTRLERLIADLLILATSAQPAVRSGVALTPLLEDSLSDLKQQGSVRRRRSTCTVGVPRQPDASLTSSLPILDIRRTDLTQALYPPCHTTATRSQNAANARRRRRAWRNPGPLSPGAYVPQSGR